MEMCPLMAIGWIKPLPIVFGLDVDLQIRTVVNSQSVF